jgi:hypothetical protein
MKIKGIEYKGIISANKTQRIIWVLSGSHYDLPDGFIFQRKVFDRRSKEYFDRYVYTNLSNDNGK